MPTLIRSSPPTVRLLLMVFGSDTLSVAAGDVVRYPDTVSEPVSFAQTYPFASIATCCGNAMLVVLYGPLNDWLAGSK